MPCTSAYGSGAFTDPNTGQCFSQPPEPTCPAPNLEHPETGECYSPQSPEECYENGLAYNNQTQQCVEVCENGMLNGICLDPAPENEDNCDETSPDYQGYYGNGNTRFNYCSSQHQCEGGSFGLVNGQPSCIPDDYGPELCKAGTMAIIDEYGMVCETSKDKPDPEPQPPEEPNTDTDGDGQPDEYDRENDPDATNKGLDQINESVGEGNAQLETANQRLDKVGNALDAVNKNLNEGLGTANQTLNQINDKLDGPDDGYNTSGLGDAPTFAESSDRLKASIAGNATIQAVTTIPTIASNNTCPVWTIPSTDYWQAMPIDSHCQILNDHRGLLSLLFIAVWTLAAVFVFLRA